MAGIPAICNIHEGGGSKASKFTKDTLIGGVVSVEGYLELQKDIDVG